MPKAPMVKRESELRMQITSDHAAMVEMVQNDSKLADQALQLKLAKRKKNAQNATSRNLSQDVTETDM
jgi:hypothetical protein